MLIHVRSSICFFLQLRKKGAIKGFQFKGVGKVKEMVRGGGVKGRRLKAEPWSD